MDQLAHQADLGLRHVQRVALRRLGHNVRLRTVVWAHTGCGHIVLSRRPVARAANPECDRQAYSRPNAREANMRVNCAVGRMRAPIRERVACCTPKPSCRTALCCLLHGRTCLPPCGKNDSAAVANDECSENTRTYAWPR